MQNFTSENTEFSNVARLVELSYIAGLDNTSTSGQGSSSIERGWGRGGGEKRRGSRVCVGSAHGEIHTFRSAHRTATTMGLVDLIWTMDFILIIWTMDYGLYINKTPIATPLTSTRSR